MSPEHVLLKQSSDQFDMELVDQLASTFSKRIPEGTAPGIPTVKLTLISMVMDVDPINSRFGINHEHPISMASKRIRLL